MPCDRLATDLRPRRDRLGLPVWLGKSLHEIKFKEWLATNLRPWRMTYEAIEWITTNLQRLATEGGSSCELRHSQVKVISSMTVLTVKSGRAACRFQWRVGQSCCEYSGVMLGLHWTPEELRTDLRPKNYQTRGNSGVGQQGRMFLLCYSPEGHKLLLNTRNDSGLLATEIDKLHDRY